MQNRGKNPIRIAVLFLVVASVLCGCTPGIIFVSKPLAAPVRAPSVQIVHGKDTVPVPENLQQRFSDELSRMLYSDGLFQKGAGVSMEWRFIQFEYTPLNFFGQEQSGVQAAIEVRYSDPQGKVLSVVQAESEIPNKMYPHYPVENAASLIAAYTKENFR